VRSYFQRQSAETPCHAASQRRSPVVRAVAIWKLFSVSTLFVIWFLCHSTRQRLATSCAHTMYVLRVLGLFQKLSSGGWGGEQRVFSAEWGCLVATCVRRVDGNNERSCPRGGGVDAALMMNQFYSHVQISHLTDILDILHIHPSLLYGRIQHGKN